MTLFSSRQDGKSLPRKLRAQKERRFAVMLLTGFTAAAQLTVAQTSPPSEALDFATISRIREEGLNRSHIMEAASELADEVGPRLTGSLEFERGAQWAVAKLHSIGLADAHEESWGEFGMSWTQLGTTLLLEKPVPATLVAQATPWSPATQGEVTAPVVLIPKLTSESELAQFQGKLAGKVVLYGAPPEVDLHPKSPLVPVDEAYFAARMNYPSAAQPSVPSQDLEAARENKFRARVGQFFAKQGVVAVLSPSPGDAATFHDDDSLGLGWLIFQAAHKQAIPSAALAPDAYGRLARLCGSGVPVTVKLDIRARFGSEHVDGQNVIGDIPGTDARLKDQIVMLGGHLDSWAAATGATDDGAAVLIALEALRILKACGVQPRRTIRVGLWGGEEQGMLGSLGYVGQHFAVVNRRSGAPWDELPAWERPAAGIVPKQDYDKLDVYFNLDAGGGRILGIYLENNLGAADVFRRWIEPVQDLGFSHVSLLPRRGVDSVRFEEAGLPGFEFMQDIRDYDTRTHHTNLDTYERLSEADLKQAATVMAIFVFNAAQSNTMIPRKAQ